MIPRRLPDYVSKYHSSFTNQSIYFYHDMHLVTLFVIRIPFVSRMEQKIQFIVSQNKLAGNKSFNVIDYIHGLFSLKVSLQKKESIYQRAFCLNHIKAQR